MTKALFANKAFLAIAAVAAALFMAGPSTAKAGTDVGVYFSFGSPGYYGAHYAPRRHYRPDRHYRHHRHYRHRNHWRGDYLPKRRVVRKMHRRGYRACRNVRLRGDSYRMSCRRTGKVFRIRADAYNGQIIGRRRIY